MMEKGPKRRKISAKKAQKKGKINELKARGGEKASG